IERLLAAMPEGAVKTEPVVKDGYALALVESARGQNLCWVWIRNGVVERYKVRTASFCNWMAIEHAIQGEIVPDFPLVNKSLNLSYAGTDL
ncbi:MAG: hydrogenase large subunit, partial [Methanoregula sp.]|nr:hydrogenase large subunit [Methanoregula sp.]